jgi:hypothetical protein
LMFALFSALIYGPEATAAQHGQLDPAKN